jgi:hypothetical protein
MYHYACRSNYYAFPPTIFWGVATYHQSIKELSLGVYLLCVFL